MNTTVFKTLFGLSMRSHDRNTCAWCQKWDTLKKVADVLVHKRRPGHQLSWGSLSNHAIYVYGNRNEEDTNGNTTNRQRHRHRHNHLKFKQTTWKERVWGSVESVTSKRKLLFLSSAFATRYSHYDGNELIVHRREKKKPGFQQLWYMSFRLSFAHWRYLQLMLDFCYVNLH